MKKKKQMRKKTCKLPSMQVMNDACRSVGVRFVTICNVSVVVIEGSVNPDSSEAVCGSSSGSSTCILASRMKRVSETSYQL